MFLLSAPEHLLPFSKPWILVDRVLYSDHAAHISTCKLISLSDYFLQGHFQDYSVYPGVLLIEGIRQSVYLLLEPNRPVERSLIEFLDMQVRFLSPVTPGEIVKFNVYISNLYEPDDYYLVTATGSVDDKPMVIFKSKCRQLEIKAENLSG
ncbi:3-hydroxyacyl-ACP dehydratase FabZ family protein [Paenibacillus dendritiformis]|uniref:3-hydroxyacyl-ACP dehydratase FabZ family protein n=1 Tax=Paenibacillus dendritiformis TaxID=130049 RepID=UPI0018CCFCC4|nr:hypothetical protein [Paenibacillus dendritiformis]